MTYVKQECMTEILYAYVIKIMGYVKLNIYENVYQ